MESTNDYRKTNDNEYADNATSQRQLHLFASYWAQRSLGDLLKFLAITAESVAAARTHRDDCLPRLVILLATRLGRS